MISIQLPDGSRREFPGPVTVAEVAASIGAGLAKAALAGRIGHGAESRVVDTSYRIDHDAQLAIVTDKDADGLEVIRHSTAHLLAYAVKELFPDAQVTIGPVIENGFYYDFAYKRPFTPEDLAAIEAKMAELAKKDEPVDAPRAAARRGGRAFQAHRRALQGRDHRQHPGRRGRLAVPRGQRSRTCAAARTCRARASCKHFKLMKVAGAYWRGDHRNEMLQRIYGTAWATKDELQQYLHMLEEAEKRDHRKLGRELDLFHIDEDAPGVVFWHPKGWAVWQQVEQYMRAVYRDNGYQEVKGPQILDKSLWEKTGHWENYRENMFTTESEKREYALKPMNCPGHVLIFKSQHAQLPRPAAALRRVRPVPPQRAERRAARDHARARLHAGRRPHLLHRGPDPRRVRRLHGAAAEGLPRLRLHATSSTRSRRGRRTASAPTSSGTRPSTR